MVACLERHLLALTFLTLQGGSLTTLHALNLKGNPLINSRVSGTGEGLRDLREGRLPSMFGKGTRKRGEGRGSYLTVFGKRGGQVKWRRFDNDPSRKGRLQKKDPLRGIRVYRIKGCKWIFLVGKKPWDDDRLTLQVAHGDDYFFQHNGMGGGNHVLIRHPDHPKAVPKIIQKIAGGLAVYYSQNRKKGKGVVKFAQAKTMYKRADDPPGAISHDSKWGPAGYAVFQMLDPFGFPAFNLSGADRKRDHGYWYNDQRRMDEIVEYLYQHLEGKQTEWILHSRKRRYWDGTEEERDEKARAHYAEFSKLANKIKHRVQNNQEYEFDPEMYLKHFPGGSDEMREMFKPFFPPKGLVPNTLDHKIDMLLLRLVFGNWLDPIDPNEKPRGY